MWWGGLLRGRMIQLMRRGLSLRISLRPLSVEVRPKTLQVYKPTKETKRNAEGICDRPRRCHRC
ncbi:protein of unknown function [Candidatus Filomicrobium marinum]|uniref:Uncharacterized protein n=1 Tax=Candidatus Filomicrobium marinum TaxID=1608628 RepID=A0A0D6JCR5_9HYPH|nr:protein of unknown function [Candidatus Filomicrobium marinum]CPR16703.1 protein of unknown function [Candidatus Filomicrobium marinum]